MKIICGHYGCGKTNLTINLALDSVKENDKVTVIDLDIVNPYFRTSDYKNFFEKHNIALISPTFAGTTLDTPSLPPQMFAAFDMQGEVFIDVGGDDIGATALGSMKKQFENKQIEMIYVINKYRVMSQTAEEAVTLLREIEYACGLKATAVINNSHLCEETTIKTVLDSIDFAKETANLCGLPLLYSTVPEFAVESLDEINSDENIKVIKRYVGFPWD